MQSTADASSLSDLRQSDLVTPSVIASVEAQRTAPLGKGLVLGLGRCMYHLPTVRGKCSLCLSLSTLGTRTKEQEKPLPPKHLWLPPCASVQCTNRQTWAHTTCKPSTYGTLPVSQSSVQTNKQGTTCKPSTYGTLLLLLSHGYMGRGWHRV